MLFVGVGAKAAEAVITQLRGNDFIAPVFVYIGQEPIHIARLEFQDVCWWTQWPCCSYVVYCDDVLCTHATVLPYV